MFAAIEFFTEYQLFHIVKLSSAIYKDYTKIQPFGKW